MSTVCPASESVAARSPDVLAPRIQRLKHRLLTADYEICMARARYYTEVYRETEGLDPALRAARALERTLEKQRIFIYPDEHLVGTKTECFLSTPLSVERGDFLRSLQLELDILERKQKPFLISDEDAAFFRNQILAYWDGRTLHDAKSRKWAAEGIVATKAGAIDSIRRWRDAVRFVRYVGKENLRKILGANVNAPLSLRRLRDLRSLRFEFAYVNPTPAVYCMDVQGHLCLGVDMVIEYGMTELIRRAAAHLARLREQQPDNRRGIAFLEAVIISLEAAIRYAERFAELAETRARATSDDAERWRLERIAAHCRRVPGEPARSFHEALQAAWMAQAVGEIQFGTMDVFAVGRVDQFLYPFFARDIVSGQLTEDDAIGLVQEYFLKLSANVSPTPEVGMESNAVLGNSQHCVTIGGRASGGDDGTNELSELMLRAYEQMRGSVNQLCVRIDADTPREFTRRATEVFRRTNGIAFYNDEAIVAGLIADGFTPEDARDYCIVGCVETCGHSNTQGCVAGHDFILPAVLMLSLTNGAYPPPSPGQQVGYPSGAAATLTGFEQLMEAFGRQLCHQLDTMIRAIAGKDSAHEEMLPAPYVSALVDGCVDRAKDITAGGARYDFTSIDVRGLGTLVDSLLAIKTFVYDRGELTLEALVAILLDDFQGHEVLRQRLMREPLKYGTGNAEADALALRVVELIHRQLAGQRNIRGGRYRVAYFSLGSHVVDGFFLGATPDGRRRGMPISNGVSPSNLVDSSGGPQACMRSAAKLPPEQASSGIALNLRFHPSFIKNRQGVETFASMLERYFAGGGMHLQPNFVSAEQLRAAQRHPDQYRDLIVKVSGYSACFTDLGRSIQEDIIARAEFGAQR
jgi:pyruvate-formate lyase